MSQDNPRKSVDMDNDPIFPVDKNLIAVGQIAPDFSFTLTRGTTMKLSELIQKGPVLLNFIKGTWCPFCGMHMLNLRRWQSKLVKKNVSILVISNEDVKTLREWAQENNVDYLLGSVNGAEVFPSYHINLEKEKFSKPTTLLIEWEMTVRFVWSSALARNEKLQTEIDKNINLIK